MLLKLSIHLSQLFSIMLLLSSLLEKLLLLLDAANRLQIAIRISLKEASSSQNVH